MPAEAAKFMQENVTPYLPVVACVISACALIISYLGYRLASRPQKLKVRFKVPTFVRQTSFRQNHHAVLYGATAALHNDSHFEITVEEFGLIVRKSWFQPEDMKITSNRRVKARDREVFEFTIIPKEMEDDWSGGSFVVAASIENAIGLYAILSTGKIVRIKGLETEFEAMAKDIKQISKV